MEPHIDEAQSLITPLKKVTPLSKYLAMTLFIILPFLGGWVGYSLAPEKVTVNENVNLTKESKPVTQVSGNTPNLEKTTKSTFKIFPFISQECRDIISNTDQYYAVYANDLTLGQIHRCDYERRTGRTYELSSTTIRVVDWDLPQVQDQNLLEPREYKNVNLSKDLERHTQLPHMIALSTTTDEIILTSHCFMAKECSFSGLYKLDLVTDTLSQMKNSSLFDVAGRASIISPDKTKVISSDSDYDMKALNSLYLVDLKTDTYKTLDTIDPSSVEGTFCTGGMGGCADISVNWLPENKIEVQIYKTKGQRESRIYSLE